MLSLSLVSGCGNESSSESAAEQGLQALSIFDFEEAYDDLTTAVEGMSPSDPEWVELAYALGISAWHRSPSTPEFVQEASDLFEEVAITTEDEAVRNRCYLNLGRIAEVKDFADDPKNAEVAREYYLKVAEAVPGTDLGSRAILRLAQTYIDDLNQEGYQEAVNIVRSYFEEDPDAPYANVGWQFVGDIERFYLGDEEAALEAMQLAYAKGFAVESKEDVYIWQMSQLATHLGLTEDAVTYYTTIVTKYPRSRYRWIAREELIKLAEQNPELEIEIPELTAYGEV
ncbi:hypothetical protein H5P30_17740 [Puniceicoccus vermicola]|uniref:Tetratricopeptide repeat protein n=1 Tax=Puniceicoccus vermicola TaxID=388746 RepID=A0A7X1B146_9BACT|nr:hypothetical protein [Puniceicoccus vermicola]